MAEPLSIPQLDGTTANPLADSPSATELLTPEQRSAGIEALDKLPETFDDDDPFYVPPADIPQEAGSLIRQAEAQDLLGEATGDWPATAQRILFTSTTSNGDKVATSGLVMEPKSAWIGEGERPTVVIAPGTRGAADACAPSRGLMLAGGMNAETMALGVNYELPIAYLAAASGARVILSDYIGLGTPGPHTYVNHEEEGNAVLDAARAGLAAAGVPSDSPIGL